MARQRKPKPAAKRASRSRAPSQPPNGQHSSSKALQSALRAQADEFLRVRDELERTRDWYHRLFDDAPVAYMTMDNNGVIEHINATGAQLFRLPRMKIVARPLMCFVFPGDRQLYLNHLLRCRRSIEAPASCELRLRLRNDELIPVQLVSRTLHRPDLGGDCLRTVITDLSDRNRSEEEKLRLQERELQARSEAEAKDRFIAQLSHELRTPLTPVLAAVSAMGSDGNVPPEMRPLIQMIRRNVEIEAHLIDDLLDVTRIARGKMTLETRPVDLHDVVSEAIEIAHLDIADKRLTVNAALHAEHHHVSGDPVRLRQVVLNLLKNAIKFTPAGGRIRISAWNPSPTRFFRQVLEPQHVFVEVADSGIGIDPGNLERIFRPFEQIESPQQRGGGLGLGLAISKGLVEAHHGRITAHSGGLGTGTKFRIELNTIPEPAASDAPTSELPHPMPEPAAPDQLPPLPKKTSSRGLRILLVEDHSDTARIISRLLRSEGHAVTIAGSLHDAMRHASDDLDLLISDIGLPDGTGLDLMRQLRSHHMRGIALSGYGTETDVNDSREAGFQEHLTKPIDFARLLESIQRVAAAPV